MQSKELTMAELEIEAFGEPVQPEVTFFDGTALDILASQAAGKRTLRPAVYVRIRFPKENVDVTKLASELDKRTYAEAWAAYLAAHAAPQLLRVVTDESRGAAMEMIG